VYSSAAASCKTLLLFDNPAVINEVATRCCSPSDVWRLLLLMLLLQDFLPV
jgi:hypothetical protein